MLELRFKLEEEIKNEERLNKERLLEASKQQEKDNIKNEKLKSDIYAKNVFFEKQLEVEKNFRKQKEEVINEFKEENQDISNNQKSLDAIQQQQAQILEEINQIEQNQLEQNKLFEQQQFQNQQLEQKRIELADLEQSQREFADRQFMLNKRLEQNEAEKQLALKDLAEQKRMANEQNRELIKQVQAEEFKNIPKRENVYDKLAEYSENDKKQELDDRQKQLDKERESLNLGQHSIGMGFGRSQAEAWENSRRQAQSRDANEQARLENAEQKADQFRSIGEDSKSKQTLLNSSRDHAVYQHDLWNDIKNKEYILRGESESFHEYKENSKQSERDALLLNRASQRETQYQELGNNVSVQKNELIDVNLKTVSEIRSEQKAYMRVNQEAIEQKIKDGDLPEDFMKHLTENKDGQRGLSHYEDTPMGKAEHNRDVAEMGVQEWKEVAQHEKEMFGETKTYEFAIKNQQHCEEQHLKAMNEITKLEQNHTQKESDKQTKTESEKEGGTQTKSEDEYKTVLKPESQKAKTEEQKIQGNYQALKPEDNGKKNDEFKMSDKQKEALRKRTEKLIKQREEAEKQAQNQVKSMASAIKM